MPSDEFCESFRKISNGYVTINDYGSLSSCKDEAVKKLGSYGIDVKVVPSDQHWRSLGDWHYRGRTEKELCDLYEKCHGRLYLHLYRDHLLSGVHCSLNERE
jgi:hypothetical protein